MTPDPLIPGSLPGADPGAGLDTPDPPKRHSKKHYFLSQLQFTNFVQLEMDPWPRWRLDGREVLVTCAWDYVPRYLRDRKPMTEGEARAYINENAEAWSTMPDPLGGGR